MKTFFLILFSFYFVLLAKTNGQSTIQSTSQPVQVEPKFESKIPAKKVFILSPTEGSTVPQKFQLKLGVEGLKLSALSKMEPDSGFHKITIQGGWVSSGSVGTKAIKEVTLDKGESETALNLEPGEYTITTQFITGTNQVADALLKSSVKIKVK